MVCDIDSHSELKTGRRIRQDVEESQRTPRIMVLGRSGSGMGFRWSQVQILSSRPRHFEARHRICARPGFDDSSPMKSPERAVSASHTPADPSDGMSVTKESQIVALPNRLTSLTNGGQ